MTINRCGLPVICLVFAFAAQCAGAEVPAPRQSSDCARGDATTGEVMSVIDGKSFLFGDGREIRLAGIETPPVTNSAGETPRSAAGLAARSSLEALILHRRVAVRPAASDTDRYGRLSAYAFVGAEEETFVQRQLLAKGQALLSPSSLTAACLAFLRAAERAARTAKLGLWQDSYYVLKHADNPTDVLSELGRFALVEGNVASVRSSGGLVYVNFGRRWSEDFTVTFLKRNERLFASAGRGPDRLAGRRIEVRGFVEAHGGPAIEATRPEQIEIIGGP